MDLGLHHGLQRPVLGGCGRVRPVHWWLEAVLPAPTSPLGKSTGEPQASSPSQPVLFIPSLTCGKHSL